MMDDITISKPTDIIEIKQLPIIEERLKTLKKEIEQRTSAALSMECTEETIKAVKQMRADLTKEFNNYEARRKYVKSQIEEPYKAFNSVYEECVSVPFKKADKELKSKIDNVENERKKQKKERILSYAKELKTAYTLDWLDVERILPNITLSASVSSLQSAVANTLEKISMECQCITGIDESAEIFAEYKKTLNLAQAKLTVSQRRKEIEKAKADAQKKDEQEQIKHETEKKIEMLAPPIVLENPPELSVEKVKLYKMTFTVSGTKEQLKALKAFIIDNNIEIIGGK